MEKTDNNTDENAGSCHWVESLYETFMMRDLVGYAGPGGILIIGLIVELKVTGLLEILISNWSAIVPLVVISYVAANGLRVLGTMLFLVMFHRSWGILGRGWNITGGNGWGRKIERILWRQDESWLKGVYEKIDSRKRDSIIRREIVFMHLTGLSAMAFLVLAVAVPLIGQNGLSCMLGVPEKHIVLILVFAAIIFLLGHYRHTHQKEVLQSCG